jgi:hypothetical protein
MIENFQASASRQGRSFEDAVIAMLGVAGWVVLDRRLKVHDIEIDIVAKDPDDVEWWIECKGSGRGTQPGCQRSDTVKKAIGVAWALTTVDRPKYMLITSHLPNEGTSTRALLERAQREGLFDRVEVLWFSLADLPDPPDIEASS